MPVAVATTLLPRLALARVLKGRGENKHAPAHTPLNTTNPRLASLNITILSCLAFRVEFRETLSLLQPTAVLKDLNCLEGLFLFKSKLITS